MNGDTTSNLFTELETLRLERASLHVLVGEVTDRNRLLQEEINWLKEQLSELQRNQFGKKAERWESPEQGCLFDEAEVESAKPQDPVEDQAESTTTVPEHERKARGHRKPLPEKLEREIVKIELPPEDCKAEDGSPLKIIGYEISEKLKYEPAKMSVVEFHRAKYGVAAGDYVKTAPPVPSIIEKGIATPELLAAIAVAKYADGLPLYRMGEIFERHDIELGRGTMSRWMIKVAEACQPIWNILSDRWKESFYVALDETKVQVLKEAGRKAESQSWMIVRSTPFGDKKIVLFDYSTSRSQDQIEELLGDFSGYMQVDGINIYDRAERVEGITRLGCAMHARRRFEKAAVHGANQAKGLGQIGLEYFKELYAIEENLRTKPASERAEIRTQLAEPIWKKMLAWVEQYRRKVPAKSKIGDAFNYFANEYQYLTNYLLDGRLEIDNGFTERAIRKFAIGRNNWLFSDQVAGANASALLYSLVITAKVNGVNPYRALVKIFTELPKAKTIDDFERLTDLILTP